MIGLAEKRIEKLIGSTPRATGDGLSSKPIEKQNRLGAGEEFYSPAYDLGDDADATRRKRDDPVGESVSSRGKGRFYRPSRGIIGMVADGHEFCTQRFSNPDVVRICAICGTWITLPNPGLECEFGDIGVCYKGSGNKLVPVGTRPCQCNPCTINREGKRGKGRPSKTCSDPKCKRALRARQRRRERSREVCRV